MNVPVPTIPPNFQIPAEAMDAFATVVMSLAIFWAALCAICIILCIIAYWVIYHKAGEPGWACLIPFYRSYILYKMTWSSGWYFFLTWIPGFGTVFCYITLARLCKRFKRSDAFTVGMIILPLVFLCVLAFSKASYQAVQHPVENKDAQSAPAAAPEPVVVHAIPASVKEASSVEEASTVEVSPEAPAAEENTPENI